MEHACERLRGLYAITDARLQSPDALYQRVSLAIDGGASIIQYRDKSADRRLRLEQARALVELCRARGARLIVNDDVALAATCGADGVHLGRDDTSLSVARQRLGDTAIIGVSCYNSLELAEAAAGQGADYLAFGRFFPSQTKPDAVQADLELIREAKRRWALPIAAIGGITADNATALLSAGADMLAVVQGVFAAADVREAAARYAALFNRHHNQGAASARRSG
jgi:thiamine-phosphate pyrophosphorylase